MLHCSCYLSFSRRQRTSKSIVLHNELVHLVHTLLFVYFRRACVTQLHFSFISICIIIVRSIGSSHQKKRGLILMLLWIKLWISAIILNLTIIYGRSVLTLLALIAYVANCFLWLHFEIGFIRSYLWPSSISVEFFVYLPLDFAYFARSALSVRCEYMLNIYIKRSN